MIKVKGLNATLENCEVNKEEDFHLGFINKLSDLKKLDVALSLKQTDKLKNKGIVAINESQLVVMASHSSQSQEYYGDLEASGYSNIKNKMGQLWSQLKDQETVSVYFGSLKAEDIEAALVGIGLADYRFRNAFDKDRKKIKLQISHSALKPAALKKTIKEASDKVLGQNMARHLVNLHPGALNPKTYSDFIKKYFKSKKNIQVEVWDEARLKKENMGLHVAVGQGAVNTSKLVRIKYRAGSKTQKPMALVGKGITFDTGGADLKSAAGMRHMKKDMGGSAALMGFITYIAEAQPKQNFDIYLALAENAIGSKVFYPSDVIKSRKGLTVEVHNTDAEGRLVLADSLTLASESKPSAIIDVATLTGAIKVGLGSKAAGLFSNNKALSKQIQKASQVSGDLVWPMPLIQQERSRLKTPFADLLNCTDGYGGAITAALFLQSFIDDSIPWAHLDIYATNDSAKGALQEKGGSGQGVALLIEMLG